MAHFHPKNRHASGYHFESLCQAEPELTAFLIKNPAGRTTIDFASPQAVKLLNKALLAHDYQISGWDIPEGYLCPPIPSRVDYLHYLADLLPESHRVQKLLDIGTGANCIYPLLGAKIYNWSFVASDIDLVALQNAQVILQANPHLLQKIALREQKQPKAVFKGVVHKTEQFAATLCNPPFFRSQQEASSANQRKWSKLGRGDEGLNFGGRNNELICDGGEIKFILNMIQESRFYARQCRWFTTLVSKESSLPPLYRMLNRLPVADVRLIEMSHGNKKSRILAWTYINRA